ncbi:MAG TPA: DUF2393 family protein [Acidobacteriota bacterium]|nr:DUF2393 family protein [Acidobacteriota bacterium]
MQKILHLALMASLAGSLQCRSTVSAEDSQAYLPQIEVSEVSAFETVTGNIRVGGEITNRGDRPLRGLRVKIHLLDDSNQLIEERDFKPVSSSWIPFTSDDPLEPGEARKFSYRVDNAPEEWSRKVRVEVLECEL